MNIPQPTRAMMDAIDPKYRNEWTAWANLVIAAIKELDQRVTTLESR
jgi:hypothetical protein